jgi:hypothetical protein
MDHLKALNAEKVGDNYRQFQVETIEDLVDIIFVKNTSNTPGQVECSNFESIKDMYMFCVELTLKGLQKLYGNTENNNAVDIATLTMDQIKVAITKLDNVGINITLEGKEMTTSDMLYKDDNLTHIVNMLPTPLIMNPETRQYEQAPMTPEAKKAILDVPLEKYLLVITKGTMAYHVRFKLINKS